MQKANHVHKFSQAFRSLGFISIVILCLLLSSCATILKGSNQNVPFNSNPQGAEIFIDGVSYGTTPQIIKLDVRQSYDVTLRQNGLERNLTLSNQIDSMWVILDVAALLIPVLVDASTGDWYKLSPSEVTVDLGNEAIFNSNNTLKAPPFESNTPDTATESETP